jgi:hypothetical protein
MTKPRRERTAGQQWTALQKHMVKRYVSEDRMKVFRADATNKTGWTTKRLDAWLADLGEKGTMRATKVREAETRDAKRGEESAGEEEERRITERVRRWVKERSEGRITAVMLGQMKQNLRTGSSGKGVEAVVARLEGEGEIEVEDRVRGAGGATRTGWRKEAQEWAEKKGWTTTAATKVREAIEGGDKREEIVIEFGSGWEGATEGLRKEWGRVVTIDLQRQSIVGHGRKGAPDLLMGFQTVAEKGIQWLRATVGARKGEIAAIWVSPSCKEWSRAQTMNPTLKAALEVRREKERETLEAVLKMVQELQEEDPSVQLAVENTDGGLKDVELVKEKLGKGTKVWGCRYGERKSEKTYRVWLSKETAAEFTPREAQGRESVCQWCRRGELHPEAALPQKGDKRGRVSLPGMTGDAAANRVPPALAQEISRAMKTARTKIKQRESLSGQNS